MTLNKLKTEGAIWGSTYTSCHITLCPDRHETLFKIDKLEFSQLNL